MAPGGAPAEVRESLRVAFYSGAQAALTVSAEAMGRFRDEIVDMSQDKEQP